MTPTDEKVHGYNAATALLGQGDKKFTVRRARTSEMHSIVRFQKGAEMTQAERVPPLSGRLSLPLGGSRAIRNKARSVGKLPPSGLNRLISARFGRVARDVTRRPRTSILHNEYRLSKRLLAPGDGASTPPTYRCFKRSVQVRELERKRIKADQSCCKVLDAAAPLLMDWPV